MPFSRLDTAAVSRALAQIAESPEDLVDAFFEVSEEVELPPEGEAPGLRVRREEGFAVRLVRGNQAWYAARDVISSPALTESLRQVARVLPGSPYPEPYLEIVPPPAPPSAEDLAELPLAIGRAIRARHAAFPLRLTVRRHRRDVQVVGPRLVPAAERESYFSLISEAPWGRWGTLAAQLGPAEVEHVAELLVERFRCRHAAPPAPGRQVVVLAPGAAAVLLHEAVAHALEADTLAAGGDPAHAVGVALGPAGLHVLDDPARAPASVRRASDDEGAAVVRRWLLRDGVVEQPLADRAWSRESEALVPGAGRRASRHFVPGPRSYHLELLAGTTPEVDLLAEADGGLYVFEVDRGTLDPATGRFSLVLPAARRIRGAALGEPVGSFRLTGLVADLIGRITAIGDTPRHAGAGWCAKGGQRLPVWATTPGLRLEAVEVVP